MDKEKLYQITKIIAESDSFGKRVAFTFDERSLVALEEMTQEGFIEIIVRDPEKERVLVISSLQSIPRKGRYL